MSWVEFHAGTSRVLLQSHDILAVLERTGSDICDIYTSAFPAGITVDHTYQDIEDMLLGADDEGASNDDMD